MLLFSLSKNVYGNCIFYLMQTFGSKQQCLYNGHVTTYLNYMYKLISVKINVRNIQ